MARIGRNSPFCSLYVVSICDIFAYHHLFSRGLPLLELLPTAYRFSSWAPWRSFCRHCKHCNSTPKSNPCGSSYVAKTTEQLEHALDAMDAHGVELRATEVVGGGNEGAAKFDREVERVHAEVNMVDSRLSIGRSSRTNLALSEHSPKRCSGKWREGILSIMWDSFP